jgi:exopolysaccharide production protein ExoY
MTVHFTDVPTQSRSLVSDEPRSILAKSANAGVGRKSHYGRIGKRGLDLVLVALTAPLTVPLIALMAVLVLLDGGNPFYTQKRVGRKGRSFRMWKLRTMVPNAKEELERLIASDDAIRSEWESSQKLKRDPRVTRVGRILRKTSMDELPQLFNVLRGDMSLVGPRPMMEEQKSMYPGSSYYVLRPGITGTWQVSARNHCGFRDRAEFDNDYAANMSLGTDLGILFKTVAIVARGTGY